MLKDLSGQSYMEMRFYKRYPLESSKMRIIDLDKNYNETNQKKN